MDGGSCDPDVNTYFFNNDIDFGISALVRSVQVCLFVSIFKEDLFA